MEAGPRGAAGQLPGAGLTTGDLCRLFAFSFGNGVLISSYFIVTLPIECKRIDENESAVYLGRFVAVAGLTQLICPIVGLVSDRSTHPWGKRRPFIFYGGLVGILGLALQWYARSLEFWGLYLLAFTASMLALNVIYSSMNGLIADFVPGEQVGQANGVIAMLSVCGAVSSFAVFHMIGELGPFYVFYIGVIAFTVGTTFFAANRPLAPYDPVHQDLIEGNGAVPTNSAPAANCEGQMFDRSITSADIKRAFIISPTEHRDFFLILVSRTLYYMGVSSQAFLMYYLRDTLSISEVESERFTAVLAVVGQFCGVLTAFPVGYLSDKLSNGRKKYVYLACAILALCNLALIGAGSKTNVTVITCILGAANGMYLTMDGSLAVDALPNKEEAARFLGIWGVGAFIGTALGPMIGGPVLMLFLSPAGGYGPAGYALLLTLSAVYLTGSAIVLRSTTVN